MAVLALDIMAGDGTETCTEAAEEPGVCGEATCGR